MDNKQMTKIIKKGLGKKTFPFEYDKMKGTFRFISVKELSYDYGEGFNWATINVEVDLIEDNPTYVRWLKNTGRKSMVTRRRNGDIYWTYNETLLHTLLNFYSIHSSKLGKITYKKKPNDLRKHPHINLNQETNKENC